MLKLTIFHLYPGIMNLYGDHGNVLTLKKRCEWRNIKIEIVNVKRNDRVDFKKADLIFMGGGQDRGQKAVVNDLLSRQEAIKTEINKGMAALTICGGFQLFGKYFKTTTGEILEGISVFDAYTVAGQQRCIGNIVVDITGLAEKWALKNKYYEQNVKLTTLVGFENHSGLTYLESSKPLGNVLIGYGNKADHSFEGAVEKNAFGTYLHGPVLPKNPHFADQLILLALQRRYDSSITLPSINDDLEHLAHRQTINRARTAKTYHL